MSKICRTITLIAALLWLAACNTTTFVSTWKAPDAHAINPAGKTIAAVFVSRDEGQRRAAEDLLATDLTQRGAKGVAAYTILPNPVKGDAEAARAALKAAGANGAVIMRVVGKDKEVNYSATTSPSYYGGFGPYWGYGWGSAYQTTSVTTDTIISVETLVYSLETDKLLWASTSRTTNPENLNNLIYDVADATSKEMVKQGLIVPPK
jgi:hypothetical protein